MAEDPKGPFQIGDRVRVVRGNSLVEAGRTGHVSDFTNRDHTAGLMYMVLTPDSKRHWLPAEDLEADADDGDIWGGNEGPAGSGG